MDHLPVERPPVGRHRIRTASEPTRCVISFEEESPGFSRGEEVMPRLPWTPPETPPYTRGRPT